MAELHVSRKNISQLLTETKGEKFIIPEYQRPYRWDYDKCDTLWTDMVNAYNEDSTQEYFLGTIVTCKSEKGIEIIDGQQRITSLFLLLRAFYTHLERMQDQSDKKIIGLKSQIAPCIWDVDKVSTEVEDFTKTHIKSHVATESDNEVFDEILVTGNANNSNKKSLYTRNYEVFLSKCTEYATNQPLSWKELCVFILQNCIILPIESTTLDSALTIFSTLNDRGMPLSDSDIFKAQIYKTKASDTEKTDFTNDWKELSVIVDEAKISLDILFRYYTHVLRAKANDKSKEIGLRKYYASAKNDYARLKEPDLMPNLLLLAKFWLKVSNYDNEILTNEAKKYIQCLNCYPNEYWKYVTSVCYFTCLNQAKDLKEVLPRFLQKTTAYLLAKFIYSPTVNSIKDPIFAACADLYHGKKMTFDNPITDDFEVRISHYSNSRISRTLLLLNAYLFDVNQEFISDTCQTEHIFPQKYDTAYFTWSKGEADEYLNKLGNKIICESRQNIKASNDFFSKKKLVYLTSNISEVKAIGKSDAIDWTKDSIEARDKEVCIRINHFLKWSFSDMI